MNDIPRQKLCEIIRQYGKDVCRDVRQCKGLLRDMCGAYKCETNVLINALEDQVATDLLNASQSISIDLLLAQLTKRLEENRALVREAALWAVESWALALGAIATPSATTSSLPSLLPSGSSQFPLILTHRKAVKSITFSPNVGLLASGGNDNTVRLWETGTGKQWYELKGHTTAVAFSPDGCMLVSYGGSVSMRRWNMPRLEELSKLGKEPSSSVAFSPNGRVLALGSAGIVRLWDMVSEKPLLTLRESLATRIMHGGLNPYSIAFSPDGRAVAGSFGRIVYVWEIPDGTEWTRLKGHTDRVKSIAFSPDGKILASGGEDKTVRLWDVASGLTQSSLVGHTKGVTSIAFSPDGRLLASGSGDKTVRLWDATDGQNVRRLTGHTKGVTSIAFSPDGRLLASSSEDRTVRLWNIGMTEAEWSKMEQAWRDGKSSSSLGLGP